MSCRINRTLSAAMAAEWTVGDHLALCFPSLVSELALHSLIHSTIIFLGVHQESGTRTQKLISFSEIILSREKSKCLNLWKEQPKAKTGRSCLSVLCPMRIQPLKQDFSLFKLWSVVQRTLPSPKVYWLSCLPQLYNSSLSATLHFHRQAPAQTTVSLLLCYPALERHGHRHALQVSLLRLDCQLNPFLPAQANP